MLLECRVTALETDFRSLPQRLAQDWFSQVEKASSEVENIN